MCQSMLTKDHNINVQQEQMLAVILCLVSGCLILKQT